MTPTLRGQDLVQALQDTLTAGDTTLADSLRADSLAADSTARADSIAQAADTVKDVLGDIGREVSDAGSLAAQGRWSDLWEHIAVSVRDASADLVPNVFGAIFVILVFYGLYRLVVGILRRFLREDGRVGVGGREIILRTTRVVGLTFVAVMGLSQLGLNISALVAGLGIAGLAVGFAAKDSLENYISGVSILLDRPFRVGQWVSVGDTYGRVTELTLRSTRVRTLTNEEVVIPNLAMVNQPLVNKSTVGGLRVDVEFGVAYKEDLDQVRSVVMALVDDDDRLAREPEPRVVVVKLDDSSVNLELHLFLVDPAQAMPVLYEYTESVRKALAAADIEIPFPHLQLFLDGGKAIDRVGLATAEE